jgi:hypothetical protein
VQAGTLQGVVRYTLNRLAADTVTIRFYDPDLDEYSGSALTGQDNTAGTHWSDVYTLTGVEFDENGEPVGPISCVLFADESATDAANNRDGEPKPALQKGSTNLVRVLEILEPNENPVTDNNFVFDNTADPNGTCEVVATGTTHQGLDDDDLEWELDAISGSTLTSDPNPPAGPEITFTYTRLPASNSEFGNHTLTLSHPDVPGADHQTVQIFFPRDATNHPGTGSGVTPNWYYYWDQTSATYGTHTYRGAAGTGQTVPGQQAGTFVSYIDAEACLYHPNGDILGWGPAEGIDYFAWICRHEAKHLADLSGWWPQGWHWWEDGDRTNPQVIPGVMGDWIPDILEPTILPGHPYDPNDGASQADTFNYGQDPLLDIEHYCLSTQAQWINGSADSQDWAEPGHQSQR